MTTVADRGHQQRFLIIFCIGVAPFGVAVVRRRGREMIREFVRQRGWLAPQAEPFRRTRPRRIALSASRALLRSAHQYRSISTLRGKDM